jgi:hypothetical protein
MKGKWTPVTGAEADELRAKAADLDTPTLYAPNGDLWADSEELKAWRAGRERE